MKKILQYSFFLFIPIFIQAQDFAPIGASWVYYDFNLPTYNPYTLEVKEADTINGEYVTILSGLRPSTRIISVPILDKGDKIYFYSQFNERFNLLYDFEAQIGDVLTVNGLGPDSISDRSRYSILDIKYDTVCSGKVRRRWIVSNAIYHDENDNNMDWEQYGDIIEGIGSTRHLYPVFGFLEDGTLGIRCYNDSKTDCKWVDYACDSVILWVNTNNLSKDEVDIRIKNSLSSWTLDYSFSTSGTYFFVLYNLQGQEIHRETLTDIQGSKQWMSNSTGIHIWQITDAQGRQLSDKILVN